MHVYLKVLRIQFTTVSSFMNTCHIQETHINVNDHLNVDGI